MKRQALIDNEAIIPHNLSTLTNTNEVIPINYSTCNNNKLSRLRRNSAPFSLIFRSFVGQESQPNHIAHSTRALAAAADQHRQRLGDDSEPMLLHKITRFIHQQHPFLQT